MKKSLFSLFLIGILFVYIIYAAVPDSDEDGVPDDEDLCPDSDTTIVDQFGCSCPQKNCPSDNNECTDDCSVIDGLPSCTFTNNNKPCQNGFCKNGECVRVNATSFIICLFEESDPEKLNNCYYSYSFGGFSSGQIDGCNGTKSCDFNITARINQSVTIYSNCNNVYNLTVDGNNYELHFNCTREVDMPPQQQASDLSPSGIVQATGDPTYVTLRWPAFEGATHYNVRLDDGTSERIDDPRFETCPDSPHYYCENGITETFIDGVPVKPGRKYTFWVDPIIPEREYFNIDTRFEVTRTEETARTQGTPGTSPSAGTSDFVITQQAAVSANENIGPQNTIVIVAGIGNERAPVDIATANRAIFGNEFGTANDYYIKNSYGRVSLRGRVVGPYTLTIPPETCGMFSIRDEAINAADRDVNFRDYSRIILVFPFTQCFPHGGAGVGVTDVDTPDGRIRASVSWISGGVGLHVLAHELGHNFGLPHANSRQCSSCEPEEYGDRFDIMGTGDMHTNSVYKEVTGWPSNTITATQGEYLIKPLEIPQPTGAIQHIKLPLGNAYYSLEFRQPINYDAGAPARTYSGVFIRHVENVNYPVTLLVNYDPSDKTPLLQAGQTYRGPNRQDYEIFLRSADANGATVQIRPYARTNFISLVYPRGEETWEIGSTQNIKWESTNIPSDNRIEFIKLRNLEQGGAEPTLFADIMNDGSEEFVVESLPPGFYKLKIQTNYNNEILSDISDRFSIVSANCIDTDEGVNYFVVGRVYPKNNPNLFEDSCIESLTGGVRVFSSDYVIEGYCQEDGNSGGRIYQCPNRCAGGRCNQAPDPNLPEIRITSPKKGDIWALGSNQRVEWTWRNIDGDSILNVNLTDAALSFNRNFFAERVSRGYKEIRVPDSVRPGNYRLLSSFDEISAGDITDFFEIGANANPVSGRAIAEVKPQNMQEIEGTLEVLHVDDFENPENSKYIHYILINGKKYEIKSEDKLPVVLSGSTAKVKGIIIDDKFYLENYINAHPEVSVLKEKATPLKTEVKARSQPGFFNSDWFYILLPAMVIIAYLAYLEAGRIKNR